MKLQSPEAGFFHNLQTAFPRVSFLQNVPLAQTAYFKLGGPAEVYLELSDLDTLQQVLQYCDRNQVPVTILGGASNVVIADEGIPGLVLRVTHDATTIVTRDQGGIVTVGAGQKTALLVRKTIDAGLAGLEYFLGVPGTIGGAVYNNAHYLQHLIGEHIKRVRVVSLQGESYWISQQAAEFGYDRSRFHQTHEVIYEVEFELPIGDRTASLELVKQATQKRATTQPLGEPSSGCIFQNVPINPELKARFPQFSDQELVPAGFLIDQAGLKGVRQGGISVSTIHAAFFVNDGTGTASEVEQLVQRVKDTVKKKFQVALQEEVFYLGSHH